MAEPLGTEASTSAIPTNKRTVPSGSLSTYSTWSRSRELSLSIEDQSSERRSRAAGARIDGRPLLEGLHFPGNFGRKIRLESRLQHRLVRPGFKIKRCRRHNAILVRVGEPGQSER